MVSGVGVVRRELVVSVGTDGHPFDRLMDWVERLVVAIPDVHAVVQHGSSRPPQGTAAVPMMSQSAFRDLLQGADVVVLQGGPGGIIDSLSCGRRPLVVPRTATLHEHVDDHQIAFARRLASDGTVLVAESEPEFRAQIERALHDPAALRIEPYRGPGLATASRVGALVARLVAGQQGDPVLDMPQCGRATAPGSGGPVARARRGTPL